MNMYFYEIIFLNNYKVNTKINRMTSRNEICKDQNIEEV